jgi:DNA-binding CsgD family transcriptional regulator/PAS domain-containing protein
MLYTKGMNTSLSSPAGARFDAFDALFDEVVALIYAASRQPVLRRRALSLIAQSLGAAGAVYLSFVEGEMAPVACESAGSLPADFAEHYAARGAAIDPRRRFLEAAHDESSIYVSHYDRDSGDPRDALFFDGFLADCGIGESIGAQIAQIGQRRDHLYIERALGLPPFAPTELHLFRRLVRHLRQAEQIAEAAAYRAAEEALQQQLLDEMPLGAVIADKTRRVLFANAAAREILAAGDGLSLVDGRLQAARAFETNALTAHLRNAARAMPGPGDVALLVARPSGKQPFALLVAPLRPVREEEDIAALARMTVLLADLDGRSGVLAPRLMQLFGLSKAEARIAAGIAEGRRLQEIAQANDVRMPTVRTQLRAALKKIGVARQADLVRVVLTLPATLPLRPGDDVAREPDSRLKTKSAASF